MGLFKTVFYTLKGASSSASLRSHRALPVYPVFEDGKATQIVQGSERMFYVKSGKNDPTNFLLEKTAIVHHRKVVSHIDSSTRVKHHLFPIDRHKKKVFK